MKQELKVAAAYPGTPSTEITEFIANMMKYIQNGLQMKK